MRSSTPTDKIGPSLVLARTDKLCNRGSTLKICSWSYFCMSSARTSVFQAPEPPVQDTGLMAYQPHSFLSHGGRKERIMEDTVTYHWKSSSNIRSDAAAVVAGSRRGGRGIPIHFDLKHDLIEFVRRGANVVKKTRRSHHVSHNPPGMCSPS